jgi:hypothetical protein
VHLIGGSVPICEPGFPKKIKMPLLGKKTAFFRFNHSNNHVSAGIFSNKLKKCVLGMLCVLDFQGFIKETAYEYRPNIGLSITHNQVR